MLGRATLPHLGGHDVIGLTRESAKLPLLDELGVNGVVCDVYDRPWLLRVAEDARPELVVNFVTDLARRSADANNRARREGGANIWDVAAAVGASRLAVESVAFDVSGEAARAVHDLEESARRFPNEALVLRFGRLWGPGTWYEAPPEEPRVHVEHAGAEAARLLLHGAAGAYAVVDPR